MNVYVCSTVRHLVFRLCRASYYSAEQHHILFFADYQGASLADWQLAELPENCRLYELSRAGFRRRLEQSIGGRLSYQLARGLLAAPAWLQTPVIATLAESAPDLARILQSTAPFSLWLFNERNRMARLFRLLTADFNIIEDGESNYLEYALPWWKGLPRRARGQPSHFRCLGDDPRCKEIWVVYPERLPPLIRSKGREILFLTTPAAVDVIRKVMGANRLPQITTHSVILATQPLDGMASMSVQDKQTIYETIVSVLASQGREVILKLHPAENPVDYDILQGRVVSAPMKVPVEALILSASEPPLLLSVSSSAGLGFERFCTRIKLIENNDFTTLRRWAKQPADLRDCLEQNLPSLHDGSKNHQ